MLSRRIKRKKVNIILLYLIWFSTINCFSSRIPTTTYVVISFLTVATMALSNSSLEYLNFPTQVGPLTLNHLQNNRQDMKFQLKLIFRLYLNRASWYLCLSVVFWYRGKGMGWLISLQLVSCVLDWSGSPWQIVTCPQIFTHQVYNIPLTN